MYQENGITYLRPTGINAFLECSAKYYFQDIERIKVPNKLPLAFGSAVHSALELNYSQKINTLQDLPLEEVKASFSDNYDSEISQVDNSDIEESPGVVKDQGIKLIEKYQATIAPRVIPQAVEQKIKVKFQGYDYGLVGTIDLFDIYNTIIDHKTTAREIKPEIPEAYTRQQSAYAILEEATGREVEDVQLHFLRRDNTEIRAKKVNIDKEHFLTLFQTVGDAISKGVFMPNRDSYLCTRRFCKYWVECEKKFKGTVKP